MLHIITKGKFTKITCLLTAGAWFNCRRREMPLRKVNVSNRMVISLVLKVERARRKCRIGKNNWCVCVMVLVKLQHCRSVDYYLMWWREVSTAEFGV